MKIGTGVPILLEYWYDFELKSHKFKMADEKFKKLFDLDENW